jgi:hypothetical protein
MTKIENFIQLVGKDEIELLKILADKIQQLRTIHETQNNQQEIKKSKNHHTTFEKTTAATSTEHDELSYDIKNIICAINTKITKSVRNNFPHNPSNNYQHEYSSESLQFKTILFSEFIAFNVLPWLSLRYKIRYLGNDNERFNRANRELDELKEMLFQLQDRRKHSKRHQSEIVARLVHDIEGCEISFKSFDEEDVIGQTRELLDSLRNLGEIVRIEALPQKYFRTSSHIGIQKKCLIIKNGLDEIKEILIQLKDRRKYLEVESDMDALLVHVIERWEISLKSLDERIVMGGTRELIESLRDFDHRSREQRRDSFQDNESIFSKISSALERINQLFDVIYKEFYKLQESLTELKERPKYSKVHQSEIDARLVDVSERCEISFKILDKTLDKRIVLGPIRELLDSLGRLDESLKRDLYDENKSIETSRVVKRIEDSAPRIIAHIAKLNTHKEIKALAKQLANVCKENLQNLKLPAYSFLSEKELKYLANKNDIYACLILGKSDRQNQMPTMYNIYYHNVERREDFNLKYLTKAAALKSLAAHSEIIRYIDPKSSELELFIRRFFELLEDEHKTIKNSFMVNKYLIAYYLKRDLEKLPRDFKYKYFDKLELIPDQFYDLDQGKKLLKNSLNQQNLKPEQEIYLLILASVVFSSEDESQLASFINKSIELLEHHTDSSFHRNQKESLFLILSETIEDCPFPNLQEKFKLKLNQITGVQKKHPIKPRARFVNNQYINAIFEELFNSKSEGPWDYCIESRITHTVNERYLYNALRYNNGHGKRTSIEKLEPRIFFSNYLIAEHHYQNGNTQEALNIIHKYSNQRDKKILQPFDEIWSKRIIELEHSIEKNTLKSIVPVRELILNDCTNNIWPDQFNLLNITFFCCWIALTDPIKAAQILLKHLQTSKEYQPLLRFQYAKEIDSIRELIEILSDRQKSNKNDQKAQVLINNLKYVLISFNNYGAKSPKHRLLGRRPADSIYLPVNNEDIIETFKYFKLKESDNFFKNHKSSSLFNFSKFQKNCYDLYKSESPISQNLESTIYNHRDLFFIDYLDLEYQDLDTARRFIDNYDENWRDYNPFRALRPTDFDLSIFSMLNQFYSEAIKHFKILLQLSEIGSSIDSFYLIELKAIVKTWIKENESTIKKLIVKHNYPLFSSSDILEYFEPLKDELRTQIIDTVDNTIFTKKALAYPLPSPKALLFEYKSNKTPKDERERLLEILKNLEEHLPIKYQDILIQANEKTVSYKNDELEELNRELNITKTRLRKMIQQSTHTFANTITPERINRIFQKIKNYDDLHNESIHLYEAYQSELHLLRQNKLLQQRYTSTNAKFQFLMRDGPIPPEHNNAQKILEILDYALNRALYRLLFDSTSKFDSIRADVPCLNSIKLKEEIISSFEENVILNQDSKTPNLDWCNNHFLPILINISSDLWEKVALEKNSTSCAFFYGHFSEIFLNSFKYSDHSKNKFLEITLGEKNMNEQTVLLTLTFSNPYYGKKSIAGMGEGLSAISEDLSQLNEQASDTEDTNKYLITSIQRNSYHLSYKIKQDFLIFQEYLLNDNYF